MQTWKWVASVLIPWLAAGMLAAQAPEACLACHRIPTITNRRGASVTVKEESLRASVHAGMACADCHRQTGAYNRIPHFSAYQPVSCARCHPGAAASFQGSFHDLAKAQGAPDCSGCHRAGGDAHLILDTGSGQPEASCRRCHGQEALRYGTSIHARAVRPGGGSPGCAACHPVHSKAYPPSAGAVDLLCQRCHPKAMASLAGGAHAGAMKQPGVLSCASCHDVHATTRLRFTPGADQLCETCHPGARQSFATSVHRDLLKTGRMSCLSCHRTHQLTEGAERENFGCGACHADEEGAYRKSAHRLARLRGDAMAASCADCHGGHRILSAREADSPVNPRQLPNTCGRCHGEQQVFTSDHVRLPISLPSYTASVHGEGWAKGRPTAVCTDCHGTHDLQSAASSTSSINRENLPATCGRCHMNEAKDFSSSVHGRAIAHGIKDSPTCTGCHDEHFILSPADPRSPVSRGKMGSQTCARCHENPAMAVRYGLSPDVIKSFNDSYHGWAVRRGGEAVAVCVDCHRTHAIGSSRDPSSSIHKDRVVATCGTCHPGATPNFAASYTHVLARNRRMAHDWVRLVYLWIIGLTLGGMAVHNLVLYFHGLRSHYRREELERQVPRMTRGEIFQHAALMVSFGALALTGFALRFPGSWWAQSLSALGLNEEVRRVLHRAFAVLLVLGSFYHLAEAGFFHRDRRFLADMLPKPSDFRDVIRNLQYHAGRRAEAPGFDRFDYTQKAEYWALVWGTVIMGVTGFVLWFPAIATLWLPAWLVRVAEVIHYYEAILAVSAILLWHLFFVLFRPGVYPMNWTWITGRMPQRDWETHHGRAAAKAQEIHRAGEEEPPE